MFFALIDLRADKAILEAQTKSEAQAEDKTAHDLSEAKSDDNKKELTTCQKVVQEIMAVKQFSRMFWLVAFSAVLNYAVVMPWNNTAQAELLERDLFRPAKDITECCCWSNLPADCFATWPNDDDSIHQPTDDEAKKCRSG